MKLFQIIAIVFCLGIFLVPKDTLYLENMQETCCKQQDSGMDCCKKDSRHTHHPNEHQDKKQKSSSSCDDHCCSTCAVCYTFIETPFSGNQKLELSYYKSTKNLQFQYSDPYFSDRLKEIWQPPKLG